MSLFALTSHADDGGTLAHVHDAVWIVEDEPAAASLAADICAAGGAEVQVFRSALPFLRAFRDALPPVAVVLDWRLEHELSAALFMATRHRFPALRVIYWTGSIGSSLPAMIRQDPQTRIVHKADGAAALEQALEWALRRRADQQPKEQNR